jgi:AP-1 complex subunit mu
MEQLSSLLLEKEEHILPPLIVDPLSGLSFFHKRVNNVMLVLIGRRNSNAITMFTYLYKALQVLLDYFKVLDEETVRDNFVIIYELLDEMMDNGYPQTTESKVMA